MQFFSRFPNTLYRISETSHVVSDLFRYVAVDDDITNDIVSYTYYDIQNGDRPDLVSWRIYGSPDYYWTFFVLNNHLKNGLGGWPMSSSAFEEMVAREYDGSSVIQIIPSHALNADTGSIRSVNSVSALPFDEKFIPWIRVIPSSKPNLRIPVVRWDDYRFQLWVESGYDLPQSDGYSITLDAETPQGLRGEWYDLAVAMRKDTDPDVWNLHVIARNDALSLYNSLKGTEAEISLEDLEAMYEELETSMIDGIVYTSDKSWDSSRNAEFSYYETADESNVLTKLDTLSASFPVSAFSYYEWEAIINYMKTKIRIIKPDKIADFVAAYDSSLLGEPQ